jgi:hypothetical protein
MLLALAVAVLQLMLILWAKRVSRQMRTATRDHVPSCFAMDRRKSSLLPASGCGPTIPSDCPWRRRCRVCLYREISWAVYSVGRTGLRRAIVVSILADRWDTADTDTDADEVDDDDLLRRGRRGGEASRRYYCAHENVGSAHLLRSPKCLWSSEVREMLQGGDDRSGNPSCHNHSRLR